MSVVAKIQNFEMNCKGDGFGRDMNKKEFVIGQKIIIIPQNPRKINLSNRATNRKFVEILPLFMQVRDPC